ncbi:MAG: pantoate--beta-alanine ligase [Verrucomicrobiota bacterium]|nr:pantoate--beta-alanine ligase [Verrucomicrobiota bacterium]
MKIIESIHEMQSTAVSHRVKGKLIGFVPTMGCLHTGHLSLVAKAREQADIVVVSIFVNPTQFGPNEDFNKYPRPLERDADLCREAGVDILFTPKPDAIYPSDFSTYIIEEKATPGLCGISRPNHFRGVTTVVAKLFNICRPDIAVFGQKDAQQCAVIRKMVRDMNFPIDIVVAPTVREPDGLAMSSRNVYLQDFQRRDAIQIYQALQKGRTMVEAGQRNIDRVLAEVTHHLTNYRRLSVIYVVAVDKDTMEPVREVIQGKTLLAIACWCDEVRLIDNIIL